LSIYAGTCGRTVTRKVTRYEDSRVPSAVSYTNLVVTPPTVLDARRQSALYVYVAVVVPRARQGSQFGEADRLT
jgi:hypothetical protein